MNYSQNNRYQRRDERGNYSSRSQNGTRSQPSRRFSRRNLKKLDVNLFIKKAAELEVSEGVVSTAVFTDFTLNEKLQRNIALKGYVSPTPIQEQSIPHLLEGKDIIGIANTGTGKTAAFLIPCVNKVFQNRAERVLIITPTRELAVQILDELAALTHGMDLEGTLCIGGTDIKRQEKRLYHNPHFVVGTPGRLKDLVKRHSLNLALFQTIVLDEVDRMVDIGFIHDIKFLVALLPKKRQSLFFSATVSGKVEEILRDFVTNPVKVSVKKEETSNNIDQNIIKVPSDKEKKFEVLVNLLRKEEFEKVLIFGETKWGIEKLTRALLQEGCQAVAIHGNKSQGQRQRALDLFKRNEVQVLLATDVASRGLDIEDVTHVINFDAPTSYDDYVHRIGRTGRANKKGIAITFVE